MENKEFDKMFQSLKDREITPSSNALKQLREGLNEADKKDKKKKPIFIWWVAATIAILLSVGITVFTSDNLEETPSGLALPETKSIEVVEPGKKILETQIAEVDGEVEVKKKLENQETVEEDAYVITENRPALETNNTIQIASGKELENFKEIKQEDKITDKESILLEDTSDLDKRIAELLKPVDDAELDALLQKEQVAIALEEIDDNTILLLLREAQMELQVQGDSQLASSQADKLLQQAEMELKANRSLRNIFNKALETGVVQVEALFKRE